MSIDKLIADFNKLNSMLPQVKEVMDSAMNTLKMEALKSTDPQQKDLSLKLLAELKSGVSLERQQEIV
jgi:hypothetical protein